MPLSIAEGLAQRKLLCCTNKIWWPSALDSIEDVHCESDLCAVLNGFWLMSFVMVYFVMA